MKTIDARPVIEALNNVTPAPDFVKPSGYYVNNFGIVHTGSRVQWEGFGGIGKQRNVYPPEKMRFIRHTVYRNMPLASYMTDQQLLHHYFCYLTPTNLIADAALHVIEIGSTNILYGINLN